MGRWVRLLLLLSAICGAGILVVHYQTSIVTAGYRLTGLIEQKEQLRERNRALRIELGRAGVPEQVKRSWETLTSEVDAQDRSAPAPQKAGAGRRDGEGTD